MSPHSGDTGGDSYEPKWPHYRSLLFLTDVVRPRSSSSNLKSDKSTPIQSNPITSNDKTVRIVQRGDFSEHDDRGDSVAFDEDDSDDLRFTQFGTHEENQDDGEVISQARSSVHDNPLKRKRIGANTKYNETITANEMQKANSLEAMKNHQHEDEDLLFFCSLLPHVKKIPANKKLQFRNEILGTLDMFAYPSNFSSPSP
jgi:hypothetical protein